MGIRILGIDPGSHHLGVACLEKVGSEFRLLTAEVLSAKRKDAFYPRLESISARLVGLIDQWKPEEVAIESAFFAKNAKSAFQLGIARGVTVAPLLGKGIPIFEYAPTQVKLVVTGYGKADKAQVKKMVALTLGPSLKRLETLGNWDELGWDATDAIAVAICHASHRNMKSKGIC